ncbi:MAG: class flavin-dependent oxidoreductase, partial [Glaciihabitans sp.]|nr:class flavin-dependent oxidoreductase [Glaciihabitans sp.]
AATREEAWAIFDDLVSRIPLDDGTRVTLPEGFPANRSIAAFAEHVGITDSVRTDDLQLDDAVAENVAAAFNADGHNLVRLAGDRSGRRIGGPRPLTFRHLIVNQVISTAVIVGSTEDIADHLEVWFTSGAVDGFNILAPIQPAQFNAFLDLVVPELTRRGLFDPEYTGTTLRERLGLSHPANVHVVPTGETAASIAPPTR